MWKELEFFQGLYRYELMDWDVTISLLGRDLTIYIGHGNFCVALLRGILE